MQRSDDAVLSQRIPEQHGIDPEDWNSDHRLQFLSHVDQAHVGSALHDCIQAIGVTCKNSSIAVVPTFVVGPDLRDGRLRTVLPDFAIPPHTMYALYPSARHLSPKVRSFVDFLVGRYGDEPYWYNSTSLA